MAEEPIAPAAAPVVEAAAPAVTPAAEAAHITPVVEVAPVVEAPKAVEAAPETPDPSKTPTLLEEAGKAEEKPAEAKPEGEKPAEAPKPADTTAALTFEPYTMPEGVTVDSTRIGEFNEILGKSDLSPQARGQALVDMHVAELQKYDQHLRTEQNRVFDETRATWRKDLMADPEMGGSGYNTTLTAGAKMRDLFVSSHKPGTDGYAKDMKDFNTFLRTTGAGDHPSFWRLLNNVARKFDEPSAPQPAYKPPPDIGRKPSGNGRSRLRDIYRENQQG